MVLRLRKVFTTAIFGWSQYPPSLWRWTSGCSWMSSSAVWLVLSTCSRTSQTWCSPYSGLKHKQPFQRAWQGPSTWSSCCRTSCRWGSSSFISLSNYWICRVVVSAVLSVVSSFSSPSFSMISNIREERGSKKNIWTRVVVITLKYPEQCKAASKIFAFLFYIIYVLSFYNKILFYICSKENKNNPCSLWSIAEKRFCLM